MSNQHSLGVVEGIDDNRSSIPKTDLEDAASVSAPPRLANRGMIVAKFEEVAGDGQRARNFWYAVDAWDICCGGDLESH
jgi:hypothetical protein